MNYRYYYFYFLVGFGKIKGVKKGDKKKTGMLGPFYQTLEYETG
jgi:hypothetical protein